MTRFYFDDNNASRAVLRGLRALGLECFGSHECGNSGLADVDHLLFAAAESMTLVTEDASDFPRLHATFVATGRHHSGVIVVPQARLSAGEIVRRLHEIAQLAEAQDLDDRLLWLLEWG